MMLHYVQYADTASVCLALLAFLSGLILDGIYKNHTSLQDHLGRAVGAGAVPSALVLICAGFDPTILIKVPGLNFPIAFGGMALLYVSFKAAVKKPDTTSEIPDSRKAGGAPVVHS
jgi:hypothetical protein